MTDDIRKYRALVESALSSVAEAAPSSDLDSSARDAAELMVHIFRDSKDADLHNVIRSALKGYHKDTAGHHDYKDWGRAVIKHADRLHHTIHESDDQDDHDDGSAYEMGYRAAAMYHKSKSSNPFEGKDDQKAAEWEDGWTEGAREEGLLDD